MVYKIIFNKKLYSFIALIIIFSLLVEWQPWDGVNEAWIENNIRNQGFTGVFYFIAMFTLFTACGFPRQLAAFFGSYAFGFVEGAFIATIATTLGCLTSLLVAKFIARPLIYNKFESKIKSIRTFLNKETFTKTIIIRLLPVGSNLVTNLVAGVTKIKLLPFIGGSFIGYIPQMMIFALAGSGIEVMSYWKISISIILFLISTVLTARLYKNYKNNLPSNEVISTS